MTAPIASGWSESPGGPCTHWKAPPFHGARRNQPFACHGSNESNRPQAALNNCASGCWGAYEADIRTGLLHMLITSSSQLVEQRLCLFEIGRVEAFGEPAVDRREQVA